MTRQISRDDIVDIIEYEKQRAAIRASAIAARKLRRVHVGDKVTLAFENAETIKYQIQEMMRAERMVDEDEIDFELITYSALLPEPGKLSATLFIEIPNVKQLREWLPKLVGIEQRVWLKIGAAGEAPGTGEPGRSKEDVTSTVHYIDFTLSPDQVEAIKSGASVAVAIDHENYRHEGQLAPDTVAAIAEDLTA